MALTIGQMNFKCFTLPHVLFVFYYKISMIYCSMALYLCRGDNSANKGANPRISMLRTAMMVERLTMRTMPMKLTTWK